MSFAISAAARLDIGHLATQALDTPTGLLDKVALNPQPLPPKEAGALASGALSSMGDDIDPCGTVPRRPPNFPPPPRPPWAERFAGLPDLLPAVAHLAGDMGRIR